MTTSFCQSYFQDVLLPILLWSYGMFLTATFNSESSNLGLIILMLVSIYLNFFVDLNPFWQNHVLIYYVYKFLNFESLLIKALLGSRMTYWSNLSKFVLDHMNAGFHLLVRISKFESLLTKALLGSRMTYRQGYYRPIWFMTTLFTSDKSTVKKQDDISTRLLRANLIHDNIIYQWYGFMASLFCQSDFQ